MIIDDEDLQRYAAWFACLADPTRLRILSTIARAAGPIAVHEVVARTGVSQPTVSHHIRMLAGQRFLLLQRRGASTMCSLNPRCRARFPAAARAVLGVPTEELASPRPPAQPPGEVERPFLRPARPEDLDAITELLAGHGLPTVSVDGNLERSIVAESKGEIVGCAAIEPYGRVVLLRSVAVASRMQGKAIGSMLVRAALATMPPAATSAYLLTETAPGFFARLGFKQVARDQLPASIRRTAEFVEACSITAVAMRMRLSPPTPRR